MVDPGTEDKVIDPACGSGGFLVEAIRNVWKRIEDRGKLYDWLMTEVLKEQQGAAKNNFRGIDKDNFLSKVAKAYMAIIGDGRGGIFCENSLDTPAHWKNLTQEHIPLDYFDVVVTNPPFGKKAENR